MKKTSSVYYGVSVFVCVVSKEHQSEIQPHPLLQSVPIMRAPPIFLSVSLFICKLSLSLHSNVNRDGERDSIAGAQPRCDKPTRMLF